MSPFNCIIEGCDNPIENRDTKLCASHSAERRKAERDSKKVKVVKQVKKVSNKRKDELKEYVKLRKSFLLHNTDCELKLEGCTVKASEIHHAAGRTGKNFLDTNTWRAACSSCHFKNHNELSAEERRSKNLLI